MPNHSINMWTTFSYCFESFFIVTVASLEAIFGLLEMIMVVIGL